MKKLLLFAIAALPMMMSARAPQCSINPFPVPEGITVSPAQGFVEVSGTAYPKGVSNIGLTFTKPVCQNPQSTEPAKLYMDNMVTPAATTLATGIDMETQRTASVLFKNRTWNGTGVYKIEIPEGMFCYVASYDAGGEPVPGDPVPAVTLGYEIYVGYNVLPQPGIIDQLDNVYVYFPDADKVIPQPENMKAQGSNPALSFYKDNSDAEYGLTYVVMDYDQDGRENEVVFTIGDNDGIAMEFMEPGTFGLYVPAGAFKYVVYGPNHDADPSDEIEYENAPILIKYTIPNMPAPQIYPDPSNPLTEFSDFYLYPSEDFFKSWFSNDRISSYIYSVSDTGIIDDSAPIAEVKAKANQYWDSTDDTTVNELELYLYDREKDQVMTSMTPPPGRYVLVLEQGLINGMSQYNDFILGDPFQYYYTIFDPNMSGVEEVEPAAPADELLTVYNVAGVCVARDADKSVLGTIAKGLYIVNGKKVLVK